jgi:hypothetical protein
MIRTLKVLFCDNEHGRGDVTLPDLRYDVEPLDLINAETVPQLRKRARALGWVHHNGADYCPDCAASL